ncbi:hypothetical protein D7S89_12670 [Trinickia fusca]|uniref:Uncharacterized protein n=1 Tax=Trinickia fusca TaxID=2419777 RepID=A0A494XBH7_9BURK|nr:hypothetical protein D7S89_12670 [Trinickia fusca]
MASAHGAATALGVSNSVKEAAALPPGVTLQDIDGGTSYYAKWTNAFPSGANFYPIGVFPSEATPSSLAAIGINFFAPTRDDNAGVWAPVWNNPNGNDMTGVYAQPGFYAGGAFYTQSGSTPWGPRAAFDVFGDELDGNGTQFFEQVPTSISSNNQKNEWGGLTAAAFLGALKASRAADPTRPIYLQVTTSLMDGGINDHYSLADKQAICASTDIFSFDIYPLVFRGGSVFDMADQVKEARGYCRNAKAVFPFVEMDHMDGGSIDQIPIYPMPAQTVAEVWNAVIAGARGVQYFDQFGNIDEPAYDGNGHYAPGAMYNAIKTVNGQLTELAPVLNAPFANGYVTTTGNMSVMAKYGNGHFTIFAIPHHAGAQTITFSVAGAPDTTATVLYENRSVSIKGGQFNDTFADENTVHIYQVN